MTASPLSLISNPYRDPSLLDGLSRQQIAEFAPQSLRVDNLHLNKYIPHIPTLKQRAFLSYMGEEALYGGAAGGGKSDALLMAALQFVHVPTYAALLLRPTYADLEKPGALIPRSFEWLGGTDAHWNGMNRSWTFPSGAVLDFGYLSHERDRYKYKSSEYQFVGFDELTEFPEEDWYTYLFSRMRRLLTETALVPIRMRAASNPGGIGEEWVSQRFITEGAKYGRVFIRARLEDNPHLDTTEYDRALKKTSPTTYTQLRDGVWGVKKPGQFLRREWFEVVDALPPNITLIRDWDLAATTNATSAYTAGGKLGLHEGTMYIADMVRLRGDPGTVEAVVKQTAELDGRGVSVHLEQEGGSGGVNTLYRYQRQILLGWAVFPFHPRQDKLTRATPFSALAKAGGVKLLRGDWINAFLQEADSFPNGFKDQIDVCSSGYQILTTQATPNIRRL